MTNTTIAVLLYGDYPELAERCLRPISQLYASDVPVIICANEIGDKTRQVVSDLGLKITFDENPQIFKYPMLAKVTEAVKTPYLMWFDDDSYIRDNPEPWLFGIELEMGRSDLDLMGAVYTIGLRESQVDWIKTRPWYRGKDIPRRPCFATGGWWAAKVRSLRNLGWPDPEVKHRGGDVMLGVALQQNGMALKHYRTGVAINANELGQESQSKRRGFDEAPVGIK